MSKKRAKHSAEYKQEAVRRVVDGSESVVTVADDLGIGRDALYRWVREHRANPGETFRGNGKLTSQDEEIRQLRKENARLREEREILEKATSFLPRSHAEIRVHQEASRSVPPFDDVSRSQGIEGRFLCVA